MKKIFTILFLLLAANVEATTYWANPGGGAASCAAASGTSDPATYRTLAQGLACLSAGDTLKLKTGTYTAKSGSSPNISMIRGSNIPSGTSANALTTVVCETLVTVVNRVSPGCIFKPAGANYLLLFSGGSDTRSFLKFEGIKWDSTDSASTIIRIMRTTSADCTNCVFTGNEVTASVPIPQTGGRSPIVGDYVNSTFSANWVHDYSQTVDERGTHGLYVNGSNVHMTGNLIENMQGLGIQYYSANGTPFTGGLIENNRILNNGRHGILVGGSNTGAVVRRNVVSGGLGGVAGINVVGTNGLVYNNVSYNHTGNGIETDSTHIVKNNISIGNSGTQIVTTGTSSNNITTGTASAIFQTVGTNFCLLPGASTAIDLGANVGLPFNGSAADIGACETFAHSSGTVTANTMTITLGMNLQVPVLPATGQTGWTVNNGRNVTAAVKLSDTQVALTFDGAACAGESWTYSYSGSGNVTSTTGIPDQSQPLFAITNQAVTNLCAGPSTAVLTQVSYRWRSLRKDAAGALITLPSSSAAANTAISVPTGASVIFDVQFDCTVADCASLGFQAQYDVDGAAVWTTVPNTCTAEVCFYGTSDADVNIPSGVPECPISGALACVNGGTQRDASTIPVVDAAQNNSTVLRYAVTIAAASGKVIRFRLRNQDGTALAYTQYPTVTTVANYAGSQ